MGSPLDQGLGKLGGLPGGGFGRHRWFEGIDDGIHDHWPIRRQGRIQDWPAGRWVFDRESRATQRPRASGEIDWAQIANVVARVPESECF